MTTQPAAASDPDFPPIRYRYAETNFLPVLRARIDRYFSNRRVHRYADWRMYGKTLLLLTVWVGCFAWIMSDRLSGAGLIGVQILWHLDMFLMTVGIAHDASHGAYARRSWVNRQLNRVFDFVGINTYMWEFNHVKSHHRAPNVPRYDSAIDSFRLFRFHPRATWLPIHRFQHRYIFVIYALATLFKLFFLDFFSFRRRRIGFIRIERHPWREIAYLLFTRSLVIGYTLVLPLALLSAPAWQILTGFLIGHLLSGILLGIIFQVTHLSDRTRWPEPNASGLLPHSYDRHVLLTTADFCPDSAIVTWIAGGLNLHVIHHLFPDISQVHLRPLTRILRNTAAEFGLPYVAYSTIGAAVRSHLRSLRDLGCHSRPLPNPTLPLADYPERTEGIDASSSLSFFYL